MDIPSIIKCGSIKVVVVISGIRQRHTLVVEREASSFGPVVYLTAKTSIPQTELARLAKELKLPVKSPLGVAFPPGKMRKDFVIYDK